MSITVERNERRVTIRIQGRFDFSLHREFRNAYRNTVGPQTEYVVDLGGVEYLDSSALGMLLLLREHAGGAQGRVRIANVQEGVRKLLEIANFHRLFALG